MNCKDCKYFIEHHWEHAQTKEIEFGGFGTCSNKHLREHGNSESVTDDCLYATCDEDRGEFEVGQNFGCIYFEIAINKNEPKITSYL